MKLILVHGRDQQGKNPVELKKAWVASLREGLAKSNLVLPISESDIVFPFYGDRLDTLVKQVNEPMEGVIQRGNAGTNQDASFFYDFLIEVAENSKISNEEIAKNNLSEVTERGPLNWSWIQSILQTLDSKKIWGDLAITTFTYDVFLYLTIQGIRDTIDNMVKTEMNNQACVVVGHSLGTVVSYNVLRDNPNFDARKFITLGSPLGLKSIKKYLATPIMMPQSVKNGWFNGYDDRDVVALNPLDKTHFNVSPSITNKNDIKNQTDNRHGIEGYLNDKEVAKEIYDALKN